MAVTENLTKDQYSKVPTNEKAEVIETPASYGYGIRHVQMAIVFVCLSMCFSVRGHLGVTIVAMTSVQRTQSEENTTFANRTEVGRVNFGNDTAIGININNPTETEVNIESTIYKTYDWPKPIQETLLSSFFLGYCVMAFPNALISQRWGGKVQLQISLLISGLVSVLSPWLALWGGWKALAACRVVQGLAQAGTYPGIQTLLAKWVPTREKASMSGYVYTGATIGNIIGLQVGGLLADSTWGYPSTYWVLGGLNIVWFIFLTVFGAATPLTHKNISQEEKNYILGQIDQGVVQKRRAAPWKDIATSIPVWATFATQIGGTTTFVFIFTQVPSFIHYILGVDVKNSGILTSLPYVSSFFSSIAFGLLSDYLTNRKIITSKTARRLFNSISQVGVAVSLVCASFSTNTAVAVICFVVTMTSYTANCSGWMLNQIDLSPNYSGTLMAIGNTLTNLVVLIVPVLVSNIVIDVRNQAQWRTMLCIMASLAFLTNLVFVFFSRVEVQPWDEGQIDDAEIEDTKSEKEEPK